ncbi:VWA domain-containing protein [Chloroflexia bacterium SDU3-3]|nr:VWA domain-containing protein [Chloroflexia bacterium SDU3-3]
MHQQIPIPMALAHISFCSMLMILPPSSAIQDRLARTNAPSATSTASSGQIHLYTSQARYLDHEPYQYTILLDVSSSMSYNMDGEGTLSATGENVNCEWEGTSSLAYYDRCQSGSSVTIPNAPWHVESERRIYLAKEAIRNLIDAMPPDDTMRIIAFASGRGYTGNVVAQPASGWTSDKTTLKDSLQAIGAYANDPYLTQGNANHAQAIYAARTLLGYSPYYTPDGRPYLPKIIMLSDGPANTFLDGSQNFARDICPNLSLRQAINSSTCQIGYSPMYSRNRPITEMLNQTNLMKQYLYLDWGDISIIHMAHTSDTMGFADMASTPDLYAHYSDPNQLVRIALEEICTDGSYWTGSIIPERLIQGSVTLRSEDGISTVAQMPIVVDEQGGINYSLAGVAAGTYQLSAAITYTGLDGETREYTAVGLDNGAGASAITLAFDGQTVPPLFIQKASTDDVCGA